ncbi:hypothetical protein [Mesorhizobium sp.]|uniref:hypothetical protein n=1 Tax=Mesorhizobium sp. TaxID=1871066 RepID=UPI000FE54351|nr:hypothetical protein [Mesorhizobium sp.]RWI92868.1 MAG: hypothetical protein EOR21_17225 [Mesorhizobium sp.]
MAELTPPEHMHSAAYDLALDWLRHEQWRHQSSVPLITELRNKFDLSVDEACAIAARVYKNRGR